MNKPSLSSGLLTLAIAGLLAGCGERRPRSEVAGPATEAGVAPVRLLDGQGREVDPFQTEGAKARVFIFISPDCPISNRHAPEIKRLHARFGTNGVAFHLVYPNPATTAEAVMRHAEDYEFGDGIIALRDPRHLFVKRTGVTVTPEAAVFTPDGVLRYRGRINDRFPALGTDRAVPVQHDLADTLQAILDGKSDAPRTTPAVGCYIAELP